MMEYNDIPKPFIAEKNLLVYKQLLHCNNGKYTTPFHFLNISFEKNFPYQIESDLKGAFSFRVVKPINSNYYQVENGVHSYIRQGTNTTIQNSTYHYAIIPKGSKFYIGYCDVVSDKLWVFEKYTDYLQYKPILMKYGGLGSVNEIIDDLIYKMF